jgi:hypothetical protein
LAIPADTPDNTPVVRFIVATEEGLQLQVPPASNNEVVVPAQSIVVPVIDAGNGLTDTLKEAVHPDTEE